MNCGQKKGEKRWKSFRIASFAFGYFILSNIFQHICSSSRKSPECCWSHILGLKCQHWNFERMNFIRQLYLNYKSFSCCLHKQEFVMYVVFLKIHLVADWPDFVTLIHLSFSLLVLIVSLMYPSILQTRHMGNFVLLALWEYSVVTSQNKISTPIFGEIFRFKLHQY